MTAPFSFLDLLYEGASEAELDQALQSQLAHAPEADLAGLEDQHRVARRLRERMSAHRRREAELTTLYETAHDLIAIRDVGGPRPRVRRVRRRRSRR